MNALMPPETFLTQAEAELTDVAENAAREDAALHLDFTVPSPTPGQRAVRCVADRLRSQLPLVQAAELRLLSTRKQAVERILRALEAADTSFIVPQSVPQMRLLPYEYAATAVVGVPEAIALRSPLETLLQFESDSGEGLVMAAVVVLVAGVLAHFAGEAFVAADNAPSSGVRNRSLTRARRLAAGVGLVAFLAVTARVYTANLAANGAGGVPLDPTGVAGFVAFQLAFVAVTLVLGWVRARRFAAAVAAQRTTYKSQLEEEAHDLTERQSDANERHRRQAETLEAMVADALGRYDRDLVKLHPSIEARVRLQNRFAHEHLTATGTPRDAETGGPGDADRNVHIHVTGDEPTVTLGPDANGDPEDERTPPNEGGPDYRADAPHGRSAPQRQHDPDVDDFDDDLFDSILG